MLKAVREKWQAIPKGIRTVIDVTIKVVLTVLAFYVLLTHPIKIGDGESVAIYEAIRRYLPQIEPRTFWTFCGIAGAIKLVGVVCSAWGWHTLLKGQRIVFPFWRHIMTTFLIGRFIGTFLPSTIGLDGYTLYDASRYSKQWERATMAKGLEKFIGVTGLFLCGLVLLPFGISIFGDNAAIAGVLIGGFAGGVSLAVFLGVFYPSLLQAVMRLVLKLTPGFIRTRIEAQANRLIDAAGAYRGQPLLLAQVFIAKFFTHMTTAVVYIFTAIAVGVAVTGESALQIAFASTIQIFGTLLSPTIAGEGAREAIQAYLLSNQMGAVQSILSAALGFIAAEAATMWGGVFWLGRRQGFRPAYCLVDGEQVVYDEDDDAQAGGEGAPRVANAPVTVA